MTQVLTEFRDLAHTSGTSESVVLDVWHCISERNIASCLNAGGHDFAFMFDHTNRVNAPQQITAVLWRRMVAYVHVKKERHSASVRII